MTIRHRREESRAYVVVGNLTTVGCVSDEEQRPLVNQDLLVDIVGEGSTIVSSWSRLIKHH